LITNPAGTLLFVADPGDDEIIAYPIGASGTLGAPVITQIPGFAASNLTTDGKGLYLYATNAFANSNHSPGTTIEEFMIANTGALTSIGSFAAQLWQVVGEPSGKFLIGSAGTQGGADQLSIFQIAQGVGTLSQLNPATTANPSTSIVAQPNANGNLLFSFSLNNGTLNPIEGFTISSTGTLTSAGATSNVAGNGFWGQFDQNGALLFPYTQVSLGNNAFAAEIGAFSVASNGALTEIGSPLTLGTPGYFAVTDAP
jgi:6-phosphogluconolactonase (cycloisomerase 2 family)